MIGAQVHDNIRQLVLLVFMTDSLSVFQAFVTHLSHCLHAEYKSKGITVQVNFLTLNSQNYKAHSHVLKLEGIQNTTKSSYYEVIIYL